MPLSEYGAFAVAYAVFLLLGTFHTAVLTEPLLVFGAGRWQRTFREYLGVLLLMHLVLSVLIVLVVSLAAFVLWRAGVDSLGRALFGAALAAPFTLLLWLLRRAWYVREGPQKAAIGGAIYLVGMATALVWLSRGARLSSLTAFLLMGVGAAVVSIGFAFALRPRFSTGRATLSIVAVAKDHWRYGRWSSGVAAVIWLANSGYYVLGEILLGSSSVALMRALLNLMMPFSHSQTALSNLYMPALARSARYGWDDQVRRLSKRAIATHFAFALLYAVALVALGKPLIAVLYGGRYEAPGMLVFLVALVVCSFGTGNALSMLPRAMARPEKLLVPAVAGAVCTLTIGVGLILAGGVAGALLGMSASWLVVTFLLGAVCLPYIRRTVQAKAGTGVPSSDTPGGSS